MNFKFEEVLPEKDKKALDNLKENLPEKVPENLKEDKLSQSKENPNPTEKIEREKKEKPEDLHKKLSELYLQKEILEKELEKNESEKIKEKLERVKDEITKIEESLGKTKIEREKKSERERKLEREKIERMPPSVERKAKLEAGRKILIGKEFEDEVFKEIKEKKKRGEELSSEEILILENEPLWRKRRLEFFGVKKKKEKGEALSLREGVLLQIGEFLEKKLEEKILSEKEIEDEILKEIKEKKERGEKLAVEEELALENRGLWEKRKFEFFALREKKERGKTLSLEEATLLQIGEFLEKRKKEMKVEKKEEEEKIEKEKEKEIPEKKEKKLEEERKEKEKNLNKKREEYKEVYFSAVKMMEKKEMEAFREIRRESEREIKERVKEILEGEPEEAEKNKKEFIEFLKRRFEEKGITLSNEKAEKILEVELKKGKYHRAKIEWVRAMKETGIKDSEIIKELAKEMETLKALEIEKWPPEKKSIFAKVLDGWIKLPRWQRIAVSSLVLTAVGALFPGILPSTAALCAKYGFLGALGFRMGRGFLSSSIAQVVGGAFEKFWSSWRIEKKKSESLKELAEKGITLENLDQLDSKIQEVLDETAKSRRRMKIAKGLIMLAAGAGASMALTVGAEEFLAPRIHKEAVLESKLKRAISETVPKECVPETVPKGAGAGVETIPTEKYLGVEIVEKGESPLSEAKKIYMEHAQELGYKGDLTDKVALEKWAERASTRHIVGQYIVEHQEEFKDLIEKIGPPPTPDDPEYFTKLDEWLHKVPKSTFEDILHNKVSNLVYEGDKIVVTKSGDILALSPEGKLRLGHITVTETKEYLVEGRGRPGVSEGFVEKEEGEVTFSEEAGVISGKEEIKPEEIPVKKIPTTEEVRALLWEKFKIVRPAYERIQHERVLNLITETKYEYSPGVLSGTEDVIAKDIDTLRKEVLKIYNSLSLKEKAEAQLMSVDEFLKKYFDKILEKK